MPTFVHGKNTVVLFNVSDLTSYFNPSKVNNDNAADETTTFGKNTRTFIAGLGDDTLDLAGYFDGSAGAVDQVLQGILGASADNIATVGIVQFAIGSRLY